MHSNIEKIIIALATFLVAVMVIIAVSNKNTTMPTGAAVAELRASLNVVLNARDYYSGNVIDGKITLFFNEAPSDITISVFISDDEKIFDKKVFTLRNIFIDLGIGYALKDDKIFLNKTIIIPIRYFDIRAPEQNGLYSLNVELSDKNLKSRMSFGVI